MNKTINIKVNGYLDRFFNKCIKHNISLFNVSYINNDTIIVTIYISDYKSIKKLNYYSKELLNNVNSEKVLKSNRKIV